MRDTEKLQAAKQLVGDVELPEEADTVNSIQEAIEDLRRDAFDARMEREFAERDAEASD